MATTTTTTTTTTTHDAWAVDAHLAAFHRALLPADWFASGGGGANTTATRSMTQVPLRFDNAREYVRTYAPFVLAECDEHVRRRSGEGTSVKAEAARAAERDEEFHVVAFDVSETDSERLSDNDLVLLSKEELTAKVTEDARLTHALAVVDGREMKTRVRLRLYLPDTTMTTEARVHSESDYKRFRTVRNALTAVKGERWFLKSLANLSTFTREWLAIHAFPAFPYAATILNGTPAAGIGGPSSVNAWSMPDGLKTFVERSCNDSQIKALESALTREPLVLVQGAPGTGKTRTIIPLLSVLLHSVPSTSSRAIVDFKAYAKMREARVVATAEEKREAWMRASPWLRGTTNPRDAPPPPTLVAEKVSGSVNAESNVSPSSKPSSNGAVRVVAQTLGADAYRRSKILVCAPSNEILDEIVSLIIKTGLVDGNGETYSPTVVRVGVNVHDSVRQVSMDALVSQRLGELGAHVDSVRKFEAAVERDRLKQAILDEANVVCSTLSFSGAGMFARMSTPFDAVIIDEATLAVEPSTLVPLCYGAKQVYLIGDDRELAATVLSSAAVEYKYDVSMFSRFRKCDYPVHSLTADKTTGKRKSTTASEKKRHMHDPHWSGAAEFIRTNELNTADGGFSKEGFRDELIVENTKKGEAVGGDEMLADVEDGDDSNRDAFTDSPDEPAKKKQTRRSTRA